MYRNKGLNTLTPFVVKEICHVHVHCALHATPTMYTSLSITAVITVFEHCYLCLLPAVHDHLIADCLMDKQAAASSGAHSVCANRYNHQSHNLLANARIDLQTHPLMCRGAMSDPHTKHTC